MLTVLHRHDDGSETLYCARTVTKNPERPEAYADVFLNGVPEGSEHGPGGDRISPDTIVLRGGCRSSLGITPMAFVMNAQGATVARYTL